MTIVPSTASQNRTGSIALMIASALVIQVVDGIAKYLCAGYSPLFIGWVRYAAASLTAVAYVAAPAWAADYPAA